MDLFTADLNVPPSNLTQLQSRGPNSRGIGRIQPGTTRSRGHPCIRREKLLRKTRLHNDGGQHRLSAIMNQAWKDGTFWYSLDLGSPTGLFSIFYKQIKPRFLRKCPEQGQFQNVVPWHLWPDYLEFAQSGKWRTRRNMTCNFEKP